MSVILVSVGLLIWGLIFEVGFAWDLSWPWVLPTSEFLFWIIDQLWSCIVKFSWVILYLTCSPIAVLFSVTLVSNGKCIKINRKCRKKHSENASQNKSTVWLIRVPIGVLRSLRVNLKGSDSCQQSISTFSLSKRIANFTDLPPPPSPPSPHNNTRYLNGLGSVSMNLKVWIVTP